MQRVHEVEAGAVFALGDEPQTIVMKVIDVGNGEVQIELDGPTDLLERIAEQHPDAEFSEFHPVTEWNPETQVA